MGRPAWSYQQALLMRAGARCLSAGEMRTFTLLLAAAHVGLACYIAGSDSGGATMRWSTRLSDRNEAGRMVGCGAPHCGKS